MSVAIHRLAEDALEINIQGTLTRQDYEQFAPLAEGQIQAHGKTNMVVRVDDFSGWSPVALWADLKFDVKHYSDIDRLALVGEADSRDWLEAVSKPLTGAEVRYFPEGELDEARTWVCDGTTDQQRASA